MGELRRDLKNLAYIPKFSNYIPVWNKVERCLEALYSIIIRL
jgi:hypothetical protein